MEQFNDFDFNEPQKQPVSEPGGPAANRQSYSGKSVAAMVLGIVSIVFSACLVISLPCAIIALSFGKSEEKIQPNGMAKAGFVMGMVGLILTVIALIFIIAVFGFAFAFADDLLWYSDNYNYDDDYGFPFGDSYRWQRRFTGHHSLQYTPGGGRLYWA